MIKQTSTSMYFVNCNPAQIPCLQTLSRSAGSPERVQAFEEKIRSLQEQLEELKNE